MFLYLFFNAFALETSYQNPATSSTFASMNYSKESFEQGQMLLVNKPLEWTSFDVVQKLRNIIKIKKIGHAGICFQFDKGLCIF